MRRTWLYVAGLLVVSTSVCLGADNRPAERYLDGLLSEIESVKRRLPDLTRLASNAASKLIAGGDLYAPPVAQWWTSELTGRAGGPMRVLSDIRRAGERDVAVFAPPVLGRASVETVRLLQDAMASRASLFVLGSPSCLNDPRISDEYRRTASRVIASLGGPAPDAGLYPRRNLPPLAPYAPVVQIVEGWTFVGEVVGACTRDGKMPTIWQSIAMPGSRERNAAIKIASGPQSGQFPFFHADRHVTPLAPGAAGTQYLDTVIGHLRTLKAQSEQFVRGARWMAGARSAGHRVLAIAQGHCPALIVGPHNETSLPIEMYPGDFLTGIVPHTKPGDAVIAFNYMQPPVDRIRETLAKPCKVILSCPYGLPTGLNGQGDLLWLDLGWKVGDAAVDVPGYDVKMLPVSAAVQMSALYALIAEMAGLDGVGPQQVHADSTQTSR